MIAFLSGIIDSINSQSVYVDVQGIGYEVWTTTSVLAKISVGESVRIYTYQHVREDDLRLFGFLNKSELEIFKLLIGVSGVGPKAGLSILSAYSGSDVVAAIERGDDRFFSSVSGIGKKGAAKIVIDLRGKFAGLKPEMGYISAQDGGAFNITTSDLVDALVSLGYSEKEIYTHIKEIDQNESLNNQIKQALGLLGKSRL